MFWGMTRTRSTKNESRIVQGSFRQEPILFRRHSGGRCYSASASLVVCYSRQTNSLSSVKRNGAVA